MTSKEIANYIVNGDALEHFGVRGMRWGTRRGNRIASTVNKHTKYGVKDWGKHALRRVYNHIAHPFMSAANSGYINNRYPLMSITSPVTRMKMKNIRIDKDIAANKKLRLELKKEKLQQKGKFSEKIGKKLDNKLNRRLKRINRLYKTDVVDTTDTNWRV